MIVAFDAPAHVERVGPISDWHVADGAVAGRASDAFRDVDAVVEINEARQGVDARPLERDVGRQARAHRLEHRARHPNFGVAAHASVGRGHAGERRPLDRRVAVTAVNAVFRHVVLVAEGDGLLACQIDLGKIGGLVYQISEGGQGGK